MKYLALVLFLVPTICSAQAKIDVPKPKVADREYFAAMTILAAAKATDGFTSSQMLRPGCHETNSLLFGSQPSTARIAGANAAYFAGEAALAYSLKKIGRNHRWSKYLWLIEPSYQTGQHIQLARSNENVSCGVN